MVLREELRISVPDISNGIDDKLSAYLADVWGGEWVAGNSECWKHRWGGEGVAGKRRGKLLCLLGDAGSNRAGELC